MTLYESRQRLCIGGWLLAALLLLAFNVFRFMDLESGPPRGNSQTIKSLQIKLQRLESVVARRASDTLDRVDFRKLFAAYSSQKKAPAAVEAPQSETAGNSVRTADSIKLPALSGIIRIESHDGPPCYMAVLDGRVCRKQDRIMDFVVGDISADSVVLRRAGAQWVIRNVVPPYSKDQGD